VAARACTFAKDDGSPCRAPPQVDGAYCFAHDPEHAEEMAEARRLGGLRRRKEKAVQGAYDIEELENVGQVRRLIKIAVLDTLSLENSIARSRTVAYLAGVALKALEVGEFEERLVALEAAVKPRQPVKQGRGR
jgi:hypothetical protein